MLHISPTKVLDACEAVRLLLRCYRADVMCALAGEAAVLRCLHCKIGYHLIDSALREFVKTWLHKDALVGRFYDTWVMRYAEGRKVMTHPPYLHHAYSKQRLANGLIFPGDPYASLLTSALDDCTGCVISMLSKESAQSGRHVRRGV